jgi:hypothetical protein
LNLVNTPRPRLLFDKLINFLGTAAAAQGFTLRNTFLRTGRTFSFSPPSEVHERVEGKNKNLSISKNKHETRANARGVTENNFGSGNGYVLFNTIRGPFTLSATGKTIRIQAYSFVRDTDLINLEIN